MTLENFMTHLTFLVTYRGFWMVLYGINTFCLYQVFVRFATVKKQWYWHLAIIFTLYFAAATIIWVGDENLLYALPAFLVMAMICTSGNIIGRLTVSIIFICIIMSASAIIDTFLGWRGLGHIIDFYDTLTRLCRPAVWVTVWLILRKRLPQTPPNLPKRIWQVVFYLSLMPLCSLISIVLLSIEFIYISDEFRTLTLRLAVVVFPFVFVTSLVLLLTILILEDHEALTQANRMANMRELYYNGLQREQRQVRTLRHDMRNHLTVIRGLIEQEETKDALNYLDQLAASSALTGRKRFCENEAANVVLTAKADTMTELDLNADYAVSLPEQLTIADIDLCALLGNALDNAIEAAVNASNKNILIRCRADKGLFMLRVENYIASAPAPNLATTKQDKAAHGFGISGMREIAQRYGGSLETKINLGKFELVVAIPLQTNQ